MEEKIAAGAATITGIASESNGGGDEFREESWYVGVPIHSQVLKIKQEIEKISHPSLEQPAAAWARTRRVVRDFDRQQRSRSPLGSSSRGLYCRN